MHILVTGAAGFIGSVVTERLIERGHSVTALDNLKYGNRPCVHEAADFRELDILDEAGVNAMFDEVKPEAVLHLAAEAYIDESIRDPGLFYRANVTGGLVLLEAMKRTGCRKMVFSSTAAVYGEPKSIPITEDAPHEPVNAYGETKLAFERAMAWYRASFGLHHVSLRYFNACGATERFGEARKKETHIIPILFDVVEGRRTEFSLFGGDYPTPDGTCIRDYVHVSDIADAHLLALEKIEDLGAAAFNIGSGQGYSNLEVIKAARRATGHPIPYGVSDRRPGDPAVLVASNDRIRETLGWSPRFPTLEEMVASAWRWRKRRHEMVGV